tara:strand:+ start:85 stop:279 length:195 start_codon:yes stop_codon:yes gene_type:complete
MFKCISLELEEAPDYEDRLIYQMVADMFEVDIEFDGFEVLLTGIEYDVIAWIAFHLLPMEVGEA